MALFEAAMKRRTHFAELSGAGWPDPRDLEHFFRDPRGDAWPRNGGNDSWGLYADGLNGTGEFLDELDRTTVSLFLTGYPHLGVTLAYSKWDGRTKQKFDFESEGDLRRSSDIVYSMHGTPMSVGSFVPFADAYAAIKEFIETEGGLPGNIKWGPGIDIPPEAFFRR
jgi:hypothetical protein